ncbi:MAG: c-type cytochrome [Solirubrobacterales bacterium]
MLSVRLLAVPLAGLALFGLAGAPSGPDAAITSAAVAPYRDELLRDAPALCSDLTPPVAARVVPGASPGASCEQAVQQIFAATAPPRPPRDVVLSLRASASPLKISGRHTTGTFSLTANETIKRHGTTTVVIHALGTFRLSLEEVAGRWLVSSQARLAAVPDCQLHPPGHCHPDVKDPLFTLGEPVGFTPKESIPIPAAVRQAGRHEEREFKAGRTVFAESGCLACHKIGDIGNPGPGQNLTHVGARLSSRELEEVLVSPRAPMPSFKHLPANKLRDLIRFLSLLR